MHLLGDYEAGGSKAPEKLQIAFSGSVKISV